MSKREQYDNICNSIRNGQRDQAFRQSQELSGDDLVEMIGYFIYELNDEELASKFSMIYFARMDKNESVPDDWSGAQGQGFSERDTFQDGGGWPCD